LGFLTNPSIKVGSKS